MNELPWGLVAFRVQEFFDARHLGLEHLLDPARMLALETGSEIGRGREGRHAERGTLAGTRPEAEPPAVQEIRERERCA